MNRLIGVFGLAALMAATACGGDDSGSVDPQTDDFDLSPEEEEAIEDAASEGDEAGGGYTLEDGVLTLTVESTNFSCGIEPGPLVVTVTELSATTMVWNIDDDGVVTWTRLSSESEGVVGVWSTDEPELFLIISEDGTFQLIGQPPCEDENRNRNQEGCLELGLDGLDPVIDGDLSEWSGTSGDTRLTDPADDYEGDDPGADLAGLRVAYSGDSLFVLMELHNTPSEAFTASGASYRLTVRGDNGLSTGERVYFDGEQWTTASESSQVAAAVGDSGIEFSVDLSDASGEGFENIDLIMVEAVDFSDGFTQLDDMDCGYLTVPQ